MGCCQRLHSPHWKSYVGLWLPSLLMVMLAVSMGKTQTSKKEKRVTNSRIATINTTVISISTSTSTSTWKPMYRRTMLLVRQARRSRGGSDSTQAKVQEQQQRNGQEDLVTQVDQLLHKVDVLTDQHFVLARALGRERHASADARAAVQGLRATMVGCDLTRQK